MRKLNKNTILTTSVAVIVVMIIGIAVYTLFNIRMAGKNMTSIYNDRVLPLQQIKVVSDAYNKKLRCVQKAINGIISPDSALTILGFTSKQIELNWNNYLKTYLTPDEKEIIQRAVVLKSDADELFSGIANILMNGVAPFNGSLLQQVDMRELYQNAESLETCLHELITLQTRESGNLKSLTEDIFQRTVYLVLFIGVMCILVFWLIAYKHRLEQIVTDQALDLKKQNDELNTAYEELQTANEELDTTNEELYNTNEELASVNEQLLDSNQRFEQYTSRLEELVSERTHALAEGEKKYRYIIDHSPLGIFQRTLEGKYIYGNQTLFHVFECETQEEFLVYYGEISRRWYEPNKMNQFQKMLVEKNEVNGFEAKIQLVDGSFKWFLLSASFEPETLLVNGFVLDITQEKLKEIAIHETEAKIRAIFDLSYGFIGLLTTAGKVVEANRTSLEFAGTSYKDVIGKPFWETPWWSHSSEIQKQIRNAVDMAAKGEMVRFETSHPSGKGIIAIIDFSIKPVRDENGKVIWLIPEGRDITERKQAEIKLTESQIKLSSIINSTTDMIWAVDPVTFKIMMFNIAFEKYCRERELDIFIGITQQQLLPSPQCEVWIDFYKRALQEGHFEIEYKTLLKNQILYLKFNLLVNEGKIFGISVFAQNITERKLSEEKLRHSESIMERQILNSVIETEERERMNFSQELHDGLGPLLSAAKMYVQLLGKPNAKGARDEIMRDVEKLLEESSKTIREISFKLSPHILQNYGLLEAIKTYAEKIKETSTIEFKIESNELIRFNDKMEIIMYRVICECITNTIKHAGADRISIRMNYSKNELLIDYQDNGRGFDVVEVLTDFKGIGLLNMKSRIKSINGNMVIVSAPGEGTSINFKILTSAI